MTKANTPSVSPPEDGDAWLDQLTPDELLEIACPVVAEATEASDAAPIGALALWRNRRAAGKPDNAALALAACAEAQGFEARSQGLTRTAGMAFLRAGEIITSATARKARKPAA